MENYLFKKTEKIVSALYLVTDFIKDSDPVKWEIREKCMSLISTTSTMNGTLLTDKNYLLQTYFSFSMELLSLMRVISNSGLISNMNFSIITKELELLVEFMKKQSSHNAHPEGFVLSEKFFATDVSMPEKIYESRESDKDYVKGHIKKDNIQIKDKKNNRQENILNLLGKSSNLTIRDFAKVITNCSEKTIQRELISLVKNGIVKKVGERRWSTYSLA
ncbi:MAG: hypothetical protein AAB637_00895 [Patescibacteria group bacterium]